MIAVPYDNRLGSPTRLAALGETGLMNFQVEPALDRLTRLASHLAGAPISLVTLLDQNRQILKSQVGLAEPLASTRTTPVEVSFCRHVVERQAPLIVEDSTTHPLVRDYRATIAAGVRAYAGIPLRLARGAILGSFCAIDVKPRRWTTAQLEALTDLAAAATTELELRLALAAQQDMLAIVSHDLKTPLAGIQIACQRLQQAATKAPEPAHLIPRMTEGTGRILRAAERMEEMVLQVLDQARQDAGRTVMRIRPHPARQVVERAVDSVRTLAENKDLTLELGSTLDEVQVQGDAARLIQVLCNLLQNAINHAPPKSRITCDAAQQGDERVRLTVADEGPGIAPENQAKLFQRAWQAKGAPAGGHGIGLYGAQMLAQAQDGRLGVDSELGQGATFFLELPKAPTGP